MNNSYKASQCDLHVHSNNSDGSFTPKHLISEAKKKGLIIALTDHNTTKGLEEFLTEAELQGVTAVAGVELSTVYNNKELHLLGLFLEKESFPLVESLTKKFHKLKEESNIVLAENLKKAGYEIDYFELKKKNAPANINRAHFAAELCEKGYFNVPQEAFKTVLNVKNGLYFPPERLDFFEAVRFLRKIKAVPVIAHPLIDLTAEELKELLPKAIESGLLGMEVMHSKYSEEDIETAKSIATEFSLVQSGGSDYHGKAKPDVFLGVGKGNLLIPKEFYYGLLEAKNELK